MTNKAKLKATMLRSLAALVFLIAVASFADIISAGIDVAGANGQHQNTDIYSVSAGGTATPTSTPTLTPTATPFATPAPAPVNLSSGSFEVNEGYTTRIGVYGSPSQQGSSARVSTSDGTAVGGTACIPGVDYIALDLGVSFPGFVSPDLYREVLIATCPDAFAESDETVKITLFPGFNSVVIPPFEAVLTIKANDASPTPTPSATPTPSLCQTFSFANNLPIVIDDYRIPQGQNPSYPSRSSIEVSELLLISRVSVKIFGFNHTRPDDVDFMLVGPGGENLIILSDVGGDTAVAAIDVTIDDAFPLPPDEGQLTSGSFRPANFGSNDVFFTAPVPSGGSTLSVFNGTLTDGTWSLYAVDDLGDHVGGFASGWEITFQVCPPVSPTPTPSASPTPTPESCPSTGRLDSTFSGDGKVVASVLGKLDEAHAVAIQPDGKIVAAGQSRDGPAYFAVARFNPDGELDPTFAGDGTVATAFHGLFGDGANSVAVQADGKIVAAGSSSNAEGTRHDVALVRYNSDGSRDLTFDGDGKLTTSVGESSSSAQSVAIQLDGKIVVAGQANIANYHDFAVIRYLNDGSLDTTFDGDGIAIASVSNANDWTRAMAIQADGRIVVAGSARSGPNDDFALVRFNADGSLDATFNGDGKVTTPVLASHDDGNSVAIQPDGRILVAGSAYNGSDRDFAVVRYDPDGSLDTTFNDDGKVTTPVRASFDDGYSIGVQADGHIVMAGASQNAFKYDFAVVRFDPDGNLDPTFSEDGKLTTRITAQCDIASAVGIQPDGRIVLVGSSRHCGGGDTNDFVLVRYGERCDGPPAAFDYDADGRTDISSFRPIDGSWFLKRSRDGITGLLFGLGTDRIVPADYDGDGKTDIAVYRPSSNTWYILNSSTGVVSYNVFGVEEDLPTPADYDGDGMVDVSVYRPSTGTWYRQNSSDGSFFAVQFGISVDKPTLGDFDGDGKADIGLYRPSTGTWYHIRSSDGGFFGEQFGIDTDKLVPADYDGDGKTDLAVYRPSTGIWYIRNSSDLTYTANSFGLAEDVPAPGDYDGDGKADLAVFRPSNGTWYIANSGNGSFTTFPWGIAGDIPTPAAFRY